MGLADLLNLSTSDNTHDLSWTTETQLTMDTLDSHCPRGGKKLVKTQTEPTCLLGQLTQAKSRRFFTGVHADTSPMICVYTFLASGVLHVLCGYTHYMKGNRDSLKGRTAQFRIKVVSRCILVFSLAVSSSLLLAALPESRFQSPLTFEWRRKSFRHDFP